MGINLEEFWIQDVHHKLQIPEVKYCQKIHKIKKKLKPLWNTCNIEQRNFGHNMWNILTLKK